MFVKATYVQKYIKYIYFRACEFDYQHTQIHIECPIKSAFVEAMQQRNV